MSMPLAHYVSDEAFDPEATVAAGSAPSERYLNASQGQIIWWRFKRHRLAVISLVFLGLTYVSILITEFLAPYGLHSRHTELHLRAAAARPPVPRGPLRRAVRLSVRLQAQHGDAEARIHARHAPSRSRSASSAPASRTISGASSTPTSI